MAMAASKRPASAAGRPRRLLPEKDTDILQIDDLGAIRRTVSDLNANEDAFLPQLIDLSILQLFTSRSLEQTVEIYTSTLELMSHRLDLAYQTMRILVWVIPTTGFIGTVVGISIALEGIQDPKNISFEKVTSGLAVAFYTTAEARIGGRMWDIFSDLWHLADKPHGFFIASATLPRTEPKPFDQAPAEDVAVIEAWPECLPQ